MLAIFDRVLARLFPVRLPGRIPDWDSRMRFNFRTEENSISRQHDPRRNEGRNHYYTPGSPK